MKMKCECDGEFSKSTNTRVPTEPRYTLRKRTHPQLQQHALLFLIQKFQKLTIHEVSDKDLSKCPPPFEVLLSQIKVNMTAAPTKKIRLLLIFIGCHSYNHHKRNQDIIARHFSATKDNYLSSSRLPVVVLTISSDVTTPRRT